MKEQTLPSLRSLRVGGRGGGMLSPRGAGAQDTALRAPARLPALPPRPWLRISPRLSLLSARFPSAGQRRDTQPVTPGPHGAPGRPCVSAGSQGTVAWPFWLPPSPPEGERRETEASYRARQHGPPGMGMAEHPAPPQQRKLLHILQGPSLRGPALLRSRSLSSEKGWLCSRAVICPPGSGGLGGTLR